MLMEQTIEKLRKMRLHGMAECLKSQTFLPGDSQLSFEERLSLLVDYEFTTRENRRLTRLLKGASLKIEACVEDIDYSHPRGIDRGLIEKLSTCQWILSRHNVLITGPTGAGKTFIACALANSACRQGLSAKYYRLSRLISALNIAKGDGSYPKFVKKLLKFELLIIDDWGLAPIDPGESRELFDIIDDRNLSKSTLVASQLPIENWHETIGDPTVADAILDRLVHNSYKLNLKGESMRKAEISLAKKS